MLPTSIHISAFLTPIHCLAWCQIARSPSHVCPRPLFFSVLALASLYLFLSFSLDLAATLAVNANPRQPIDTESITVRSVYVCACAAMCVVLWRIPASLQRDFTRWLPSLIYCCCPLPLFMSIFLSFFPFTAFCLAASSAAFEQWECGFCLEGSLPNVNAAGVCEETSAAG